MRAPPLKTALFVIAALAAITASTLSLRHIWRENGLRSLQAINEPRVELIAASLRAEVNRQDHLPVLLSLDSDVRGTLAGPTDTAKVEQLREKIQRIAAEADTRALYVIGRDGFVVAAGQSTPTEQFVGRDMNDRSYFNKARESGRSTYLGVEPANNRVRYYLAEAIRDPAVLGVAVVRIEFDTLETAWKRGSERVLITDAGGNVFLSSDPAYKYRKIAGVSAGRLPTEAPPASYPESESMPIGLQETEHHGRSRIVRMTMDGTDTSYLYQSLTLPEFGWTIHHFADLAVVHTDQRDGAIIGAAISALILSLLLYVLQRHQAYVTARDASAHLRREVEARTRELRDANTLLTDEVDERRRTEERLRATQNELVQAGKLAALGQMSAAIAHEVNQPLAAIRTFMASAKIYLQRGDDKKVTKNLDLIDGLAERMASITSHLKTFARKNEPGRLEAVQVSRAIDGALFLNENRIDKRVSIVKDVDPNALIAGYAVQLEQVLVNLIGNALDAIADVKQPRIEISAKADGDLTVIRVADNGPGIPEDVVERIFDPFVTTKPVGKGLGLGLSITYGIVQDFRGRIRAANRAEGGAEIVIELPRLMPEAITPEKVAHV